MKAFRRLARKKRAARLVDLPIPIPRNNEVLLKVSFCGICGSDLHAWLNHKGYESVLPEVTFGHELSGLVVEVGSEVKNWKAGERAVMIAIQTKHLENDRFCSSGLPQLSPRRRVQGFHLDGGMAEYVCVEEEFLLPIPDELSLAEAAIVEPLSVAEHCISTRTNVRPGSSVVISGPGMIGMMCAIVARSRGAEVLVFGTERDFTTRLKSARHIGFETFVINDSDASLDSMVKNCFEDGVDVFIEASGSSQAMANSWKSVRPNGMITAVALYSELIQVDVTQFVRKQIDLRTSYGSSTPDYLRAFELLRSGAVDFSVLVETYPLLQAEKGFIDSDNLEAMKVLLDCSR